MMCDDSNYEYDTDVTNAGRNDIVHLPSELLERIFQHLCPYKDYRNCSLVCSRWRILIHGMARRNDRSFKLALREGRVSWSKIPKVKNSCVTDRYSHNACYLDGSVYVFGGCTSSYTTFNDLWRFDLSDKKWIRIMASGTYPSPKACSTMLVWKNKLVLFGGWSHPTPFPLHQAAQFFNQLHLYDITLNTWTALSIEPCPEPVAGHAACIMGDMMVVYGGSHHVCSSSDELWVFNLSLKIWKRLVLEEPDTAPLSRYGASMCAINDRQAVILGGCGGPNMKFADCWLLTIRDTSIASWTELDIRNTENSCPPPLWCHPTCKVGNSLVVLSKTSLPIEPDTLHRISERRDHGKESTNSATSMTMYSSSSSDDEEVRTRSNPATASVKGQQQRRQKQLAMLEKYERRLRTNRSQAEADKSQEQQQSLLKQPMFIHSLDISTVSDGYVSWVSPNLVDVYGEVAEETFFYTLTEGQAELILVGGVFPEITVGMQRTNSSADTVQVLNDSVYTIKAACL